MATSNPASISRFAEIGRQDLLAEARRERLALEAVKGRADDAELDGAEGLGVPGIGVRPGLARVRAVVLGRLGRRAPSLGRT